MTNQIALCEKGNVPIVPSLHGKRTSECKQISSYSFVYLVPADIERGILDQRDKQVIFFLLNRNHPLDDCTIASNRQLEYLTLPLLDNPIEIPTRSQLRPIISADRGDIRIEN